MISESRNRLRVAYLFGAGASQACLSAAGSSIEILMSDLNSELELRLHNLVEEPQYRDCAALLYLVNEVIDHKTDYEQIITFLDQSYSYIHRAFADDLRAIFEDALKQRLDQAEEELGSHSTNLYATLIDIYNIRDFPESLNGLLTLNYDSLIEQGLSRLKGHAPDHGLITSISGRRGAVPIRLVKLHGSFDWTGATPIEVGKSVDGTLWIPPGIQKAKSQYPYNVLWGHARELLDCDVLRIVGCRLGPNDWDLISLLFSTRYAVKPERFRVEVVDSPKAAAFLRDQFPYLEVKSILESDGFGQEIIGELLGSPPKDFYSMHPDEQSKLFESDKRENWFHLWLRHFAEYASTSLSSVATDNGLVERFLGTDP